MDKIFEHFTITILKLNKLVNKIKVYEMQEYGLKAIHVMCGYYLMENPEGLTASELVKLTLEDKGAISRALKTMQEKGFVTYDANRHNSIVKLTDEGKKFAEYIYEKSTRAVEAGSAMTDEERTFVYSTLGSIAKNLENYYDRLISDKRSGDDKK